MGTWSLSWGQIYWGLALTTHPFLLRRCLWVSYTSAFPLCLLGIFVTFHLLITVTSILQNSCVLKKIIYVFHAFRVRYEYTNIYCGVNSLYRTALGRKSNYTFWRESLKADGSALHSDRAENLYSHASQFWLILLALWGVMLSTRSTALVSTSRAVTTKTLRLYSHNNYYK